MARKAYSLDKLLEEVNALAPNRSKASDGWLGDQSHQARQSDHNPNSKGVVTAIDVTHDPKNGLDCNVLAEALRNSKDPRIKYIIWNRMAVDPSNGYGWDWQPYTGSNPHTKHLHISVKGDYDNTAPWQIGGEVKPYNSGDVTNVSNVTGVPQAELRGKKDWNDVFYAVLQPLITKLRKDNTELNKRPTQAQLDGLRDELKKTTDQNIDLANKLKAAEGKPPVEKIIEIPADDSKRSIGDLLSAVWKKLFKIGVE